MAAIQFETTINAPREKVWRALWEDAAYREWTSVFAEGSYAESDWQEGSRILFLDGKGSGMYSRIDKIKPNEYMLFRHLGAVKNGEEQPADESWKDAFEDYTLQSDNGNTRLTVNLGGTGEMEAYFKDIFPKALEKIKSIAER